MYFKIIFRESYVSRHIRSKIFFFFFFLVVIIETVRASHFFQSRRIKVSRNLLLKTKPPTKKKRIFNFQLNKEAIDKEKQNPFSAV